MKVGTAGGPNGSEDDPGRCDGARCILDRVRWKLKKYCILSRGNKFPADSIDVDASIDRGAQNGRNFLSDFGCISN